MRNSPARPISPINTASALTGTSFQEEAIAAAIASSWKDVPVKAEAVLIGEIGLAGELRMPGQMVARLREAQKLGFKTAIVPKALRKSEPYPKGIEIIEVRSIQQALDAAFAVREMPKGRKMAEA